ncbi:MAG: lysophospholipase, partial [Geopsychrobacter sp.]|nr:lysophospholipase [Geopsychrobacter sp.]
GGLIALEYALREPGGLQGVIASAPPLGELNLPGALRLGCRLLERIWPRLALRSPLDLTAISRDPEVVHAYRQDPLTHALGTPRLAMELLRTARWVQAHAAQWYLPLLLLHGSADRLTSPQQSRRFFDRVPAAQRELREYPGGFHELHNDLLRDEVFSDMAVWLKDRSSADSVPIPSET